MTTYRSRAVVEFALGQRWLLIVRHPPENHVSGIPKDGHQVNQPIADYIASLESFGLGKASSSEAAALVVIEHAVDSISAMRRELASYIDSWRVEFNKG